jgi:hypothetical protein
MQLLSVEQDLWIDRKLLALFYPGLKPGAIHIQSFQDYFWILIIEYSTLDILNFQRTLLPVLVTCKVLPLGEDLGGAFGVGEADLTLPPSPF